MRRRRHDLHTLTGVYALDAVEPAERDRFEHHLRRCKLCSHEVRGLAATATQLAMAAAMSPPPQLKPQVLAAATVTRQVPPDADHHRPRQARRLAWTRWLAVTVAAVSLALAVALGAVGLHTRRELDSARAQHQAIAAVLSAPDARITTQATTAGGTATVVVSRAEQKIIFTTAGLRPLPASKVYELWLIGPPKIRKAGLLPGPSAGKTAPLLASGLAAGDKVGVTVEPAGGTSAHHHTHPAHVSARLTRRRQAVTMTGQQGEAGRPRRGRPVADCAVPAGERRRASGCSRRSGKSCSAQDAASSGPPRVSHRGRASA